MDSLVCNISDMVWNIYIDKFDFKIQAALIIYEQSPGVLKLIPEVIIRQTIQI